MNKEQYRISRRSLRFDLAKEAAGLKDRWPSLMCRWMSIPGLDKQMTARGYRIAFSNDADGGMSKEYAAWKNDQCGSYTKPLRQFKGKAFERKQREVERYLRDTWAPVPGFVYLEPNHPDRIAAAIKARRHVPTLFDDEPLYQRGILEEIVLPPKPRWLRIRKRADKDKIIFGGYTLFPRQSESSEPAPTYAPVQELRKRKAGDENKYLYGFFKETAAAPVQWPYEPPQLFMFDHMIEAEQTFKSARSEVLDDPLIQLLRKEGSYDEAMELGRMHSAGFAHNSMKFYMEQRPDMYPQTLPGTVWTTQANGNTAEVKPYIRARRKVA